MYEGPAVFSLSDIAPRRRAARFLMPRIDMDDPESVSGAERLARDFGVCGFIVFNGNTEQVRETTARLDSLSEFPLLFGCDVERGLGQRVRGATLFPFAMAQGAANDPDLVRLQAEATAREMKYCGLNLGFAPVLDVNTEPRNPIINARAFSDDPGLVSSLGGIFAETLQKEGVMACAKHFPGHGATTRDSHAELPSDERTLRELERSDLPPFREAIGRRLCCVMPAHVSFPSLDPGGLPATLSAAVLGGLLREKLGFSGLVISDSFMMDALRGAAEEGNMLAAISRGVDIVLDPRDHAGFLEKNAESGFFADPARAESLGRTLRAAGLFARGRFPAPPPDFARNRELADEISARSGCVLGGGTLGGGKVFVLHFCACENAELLAGLIETLEKGGTRVRGVSAYPQRSSLPKDCSLVCVISTEVSAWTRGCLLPGGAAAWADGFSSFPGEKALLTFGSPYPAADFGFFDTAVAFFDSSRAAAVAAAEILLGRREATSKLPVGLHRR